MSKISAYFKNSLSMVFIFFTISFLQTAQAQNSKASLTINDSSYFETRGFNVFVFSNLYGLFGDEKITGIEIIHHGVRTATNGDVRLNRTPEQWDEIPNFIEKKVDKNNNTIEAFLSYPKYNFNYSIKTEAKDDGILISVNLENPLPKELEGIAGLNMEFLPAAYFEKTFLMDNKNGNFPLYPSSTMEITESGKAEPTPLVSGKKLILAPEDPFKRIIIEALDSELSLYDGRNKAQNGWFVVRSIIPSGKTGKVVEWFLNANKLDNWIRTPLITHSQLGYHPNQNKIAVIEFDKNDNPKKSASLLKINEDGTYTEKLNSEIKNWGNYLRYNYSTFDFSSVAENGIYIIKYDTLKTSAFRISESIYEDAWHPTLDVFFPVQMDHMFVNEAYRVWHGKSHMDDALQAPVNHQHFDLYAQGPTTDTQYKPGEHIPGLNIGGWFDAGDFDIRTQTQYYVVSNLVQIWENFKLNRDQTYINQETNYVDLHRPDGVPDLLQQIEHGTLALIAQHRAVGHAIPGIVAAHIHQYTHLGDASTKTDNLIYNPELDSLESDGNFSGTFDDRWAFTSKTTPLNYGSIAALSAASRALIGYNDELADECLQNAIKVWEEEHSKEPDLFSHGNTTGGNLQSEELKAAVELLISTKGKKYAARIDEILSEIESVDGRGFNFRASYFVRAIPYMEESYKKRIEVLVKNYAENLDNFSKQNPFGVFISTGGWAGGGGVIGFALNNYILHKAFPEIIDPEFIYRGLNFIYGTHPGSNISFVSGVGTVSKKVAYGNNRADYSFIAGGIVPGTLIIKPDFPENKEDWPFLWGENEYVISVGSSYIYLVNAVNELLNKK